MSYCKNECGREINKSARIGTTTCCAACNSIGGPHTNNCDINSVKCIICDRKKYKNFSTCCGACQKSNGANHTSDCIARNPQIIKPINFDDFFILNGGNIKIIKSYDLKDMKNISSITTKNENFFEKSNPPKTLIYFSFAFDGFGDFNLFKLVLNVCINRYRDCGLDESNIYVVLFFDKQVLLAENADTKNLIIDEVVNIITNKSPIYNNFDNQKIKIMEDFINEEIHVSKTTLTMCQKFLKYLYNETELKKIKHKFSLIDEKLRNLDLDIYHVIGLNETNTIYIKYILSSQDKSNFTNFIDHKKKKFIDLKESGNCDDFVNKYCYGISNIGHLGINLPNIDTKVLVDNNNNIFNLLCGVKYRKLNIENLDYHFIYSSITNTKLSNFIDMLYSNLDRDKIIYLNKSGFDKLNETLFGSELYRKIDDYIIGINEKISKYKIYILSYDKLQYNDFLKCIYNSQEPIMMTGDGSYGDAIYLGKIVYHDCVPHKSISADNLANLYVKFCNINGYEKLNLSCEKFAYYMGNTEEQINIFLRENNKIWINIQNHMKNNHFREFSDIIIKNLFNFENNFSNIYKLHEIYIKNKNVFRDFDLFIDSNFLLFGGYKTSKYKYKKYTDKIKLL
jgi:hypothetical protein